MPCLRCLGTNTNGKRCKRKTCVRFPYCFQHLRSILQLKVAKSNIPGAGKGLFTLKDIKKGAKIIEYTGNRTNEAEFKKNPSDYGLLFKKDDIIDATSAQYSTVARYANMCRSKNKCSNNAKYTRNYQTNKAHITATKNIKANSEIFVSYGRSFFKK
jgi:hypothetical protein